MADVGNDAQRFEYDACRILFNKFFSLRILKFTKSFSMKMKWRYALYFLLAPVIYSCLVKYIILF